MFVWEGRDCVVYAHVCVCGDSGRHVGAELGMNLHAVRGVCALDNRKGYEPNPQPQLRMCASFCADLYAACSDSALFGIPISVLFPTAPEFCEGGLGANVSVSPNGTYGDCFNAGPGRPVPEAWTVLAAVVTVAATLLLSTSSPPATERN